MPSDLPTHGTRRALRIGKYEVIRHIATGGMGAVYHARDVELNREVALKVLPPEMAAKPLQLERFRREARSAQKLCHENIVAIYEFAEANGTHFLALEYIDGIDLHEYISRKGRPGLDPKEAQAILLQAARALDHAHQQGIVHRDIKPSNFLIATRDGQPVVKLTDMGLAREAGEDEFRITRDGTTVGTVDYMSPEQARDSASADIRSDIYSLGCTLYHMLAGHAPFPEGSLTERIYKHVEEEPEDIRKFNARVPDELVAMLERMLRKKPSRRYQTPQDLLADLGEGGADTDGSGRKITRAETPGSGNVKARAKSANTPAQVKQVEAKTRSEEDSTPDQPATQRPGERRKHKKKKKKRSPLEDRRLWVAGAALVVLLFGGGIWLMSGDEDDDTQAAPVAKLQPKREAPPDPDQDKQRDKNTRPIGPTFRPLYQPRTAINVTQLRQDFQAPAISPRSAKAHLVRVSRAAAGQADTFPSLAEACKQTAGDQDTVIEIHDNGPLFEPSVEVAGRRLEICAGKGYRPLIAWDVANETRFLSLSQGSLTLTGLDVVFFKDWRDASAGEPATLFQISGGSVLARNCTFSTSGKHPLGVVVFRLLGSVQEARGGSAAPKCVLSQCYARGADLTALTVRVPGAEVLLDRCLVVGGTKPVLQVAGGNNAPTTLRAFRSTLVAGKTLLNITAAAPEDTRPDVRWSGWDTLLAQSNAQVDGDMVVTAPNLDPGRLRWQAVNCLYAGWKRLLAGRDNIEAADLAAWHKRWQRDEGDKALVATWPRDALLDAEEASPRQYNPAQTDAGYAATSGPGAVGCEVNALLADCPTWLATRKSWLGLTYRRFPIAPPPVPDEGTPPNDELDLTRVNLGEQVKERARDLKPGERLALRLTGSGPCETSPIRLKGIHLVLYFEAPRKATGRLKAAPAPLVLVPQRETAGQEAALIDVEDGSLEIVGGRIQFADSDLGKVPPYLLHLRGADLRLVHCRLEGPLTRWPESYRGLIHFEGSGKTDAEKTPACAVNESVLLSSRTVIHVAGTGARLSLTQSLVLANGTAFHLDPGPAPRPPLTVQCVLTENTLAASQAFFRLSDAPQLPMPAEPLIVQADNNLFLNPFTDVSHPAHLLHAEGEALPHGLLLWQGKQNGYDIKRLHGYVFSEAAAGRQDYGAWARLWGKAGEQQPELLDLTKTPTTSLSLKKALQLEHLGLPLYIQQTRRGRPPLGARLSALGIGPKKK